MSNNTPIYRFGMYEPATDSVIVNAGENSVLVIRCQEYNKSVVLSDPNDIAYLYRLAQDTPLLYAIWLLRRTDFKGLWMR